jgi:hypothetical protein
MPYETQVIAASLLDTWIARDWSDAIQLSSLKDLTEIRVETCNSVYEIVVINHRSREILIRGGKFFTQGTPALLAGSSQSGGFLKTGALQVGLNIEIIADGATVVTSIAQSIEVNSPDE